MKSSPLNVRLLAVLAALAGATAILLAASPFGSVASGDTPATGSFATGSTSQKRIASKRAFTVKVSSSKKGLNAVNVKLARGSSSSVVAGPKNVNLSGGSATVQIATTASGRSKLAQCAAGTLSITVEGATVASEPMYVDSTSCTGKAPSVDTGTASRCDVIDPSACLYPFPNDYFTTADASKASGRRLNLNLKSTPKTTPNLFSPQAKSIAVDELNRFDGFSPGSMLLTHIDGLTSDEALKKSGLVPLTDLDRYADPNQAVVLIDTVTGQRHPIWAELDHSISESSSYNTGYDAAKDAVLIIRPAKNLVDGRRYVVGLRNLKKADGSPIGATNGFRLYRDRLVTKNAVIESRRTKMESVFTTLANAGVDRSTLNTAWDFTVASTRSLSERVLKIRDESFAALGDTTMGDGVIQGNSPVWHINPQSNGKNDYYPQGIVDTPSDPDTLREINGTIEVPCYLTSTAANSSTKRACGPGGTYNLGTDGLPKQTPGNTYLARFRCNIPKSAVDGGGPIPTTLYGHGLFNEMWEVGSRNVRQFGNENRMMVCGADWIGMADEDVLPSVAILGDLSGFNKLADRLQQGYLGWMFLGRALAHPSGLTTDPAFQVSEGGNDASYTTNWIGYYGNSQGGIAGGGLTAVSPDIKRSVLYVGGMNYSTLLTRSVDFDDFKPVMYSAYKTLRERPLLFAMIQIMWDRGEPNGYANHITSNPLPNTPTKNVVMEMSYGDHQVANVTTEVQARTMGLKLRTPYLDTGRDVNGSVYGWGLSTLGALPLNENALIAWDIGPYRDKDNPNCDTSTGGTKCGVPSPPADNLPNRIGTDPHDLNIDSSAALRHQIAEYIKPGGTLINVCGAKACYGDTWTGP